MYMPDTLEARRGYQSSGPVVTDDYEPSCGTWNQASSSGRAASTLNQQAISLALFHLSPSADATDVSMVGCFPASHTTLWIPLMKQNVYLGSHRLQYTGRAPFS